MFSKVLIANRGAIACRIIRTLNRLGIASVAVYSEADAGSLHVSLASEALCIGPAAAAQSYLNVPALLNAARTTGAEAIHPGYGFLSENAEFAQACEAAGFVFLGPTPEQIRTFGLKNTARDVAVRSGAPILPGTGLLRDAAHASAEAEEIGYPVMLKSAGGGGGIGMRLCWAPNELGEAFRSVERLSETHFKGSGIFLEKFVPEARHIEVQIFGSGNGQILTLGERDCSAQRRNQKVVEETPAPNLRQAVRQDLHATAARIMESVQYRSAGTVEFLYDTQTERFYFLEVNARLQVEHGVTEEVFGIDLVEWMVRLGAGEIIWPDPASLTPHGSSVQVRLYAENPSEQFQPSSGTITEFVPPADCRCDTWIETGAEVTPFYDPLLAKIIVKDYNREAALSRLQAALANTRVDGIETNLEFLHSVVMSARFQAGEVTTRFLNDFHYRTRKIKVLEPGVLTTVQSYPGRLGYWDVGVPPSGPFDSLSFQLANRLLGNSPDAAALECTLSGPTLRFADATRLAITGADMQPRVNGARVPTWVAVDLEAGSTLELSAASGPGARTYLAVAGGFDVPKYLGSSTTFTLGKFGGHAGRQLRAGDYLGVTPESDVSVVPISAQPVPLTNEWEIGVLYGPHGAPDYFTDDDIDSFFSTSWKVHHNSSRTGVRLIGPKPKWAREDGGEAGLHPSNIHDNAYAIGAIDFTGDMPVILGPDGPSLGGFVCPAVIADAELWKIGQLRPGDAIRFIRIAETQAEALGQINAEHIRTLQRPDHSIQASSNGSAVLRTDKRSDTVVRLSGDRNLLIEFGEPVLDLALRFRVHAFMQALQERNLDGIIDLTPGIRSLQIHYETHALSRNHLLNVVQELLDETAVVEDITVPSRIVHLPLSWDDPATRLAIERYMTSVRPDAPWCPSNLEFIRRMNGLSSIEDVRRIVFDANYLVLGLGDVYLGAPVATPVDPRHRLVTTKYNPARTWTPENAVGIGGAYLCVYGMEGPGGYQFVGRTVQMWNTHRTTKEFPQGRPWLLRFFDQLRFYPVSADELLEMRQMFPLGRMTLPIEETTFRLRDYQQFLSGIADSTTAFRETQRGAFAAERQRWAEQGEFSAVEEPDAESTSSSSDVPIPPGCVAVRSPATASVWQLHVERGQNLQAGERALILEAMKMEIVVAVPQSGEVVEVLCQSGTLVSAGQPLLVYRPQT